MKESRCGRQNTSILVDMSDIWMKQRNGAKLGWEKKYVARGASGKNDGLVFIDGRLCL
jgi:hypothetical protein